MSLTGKQTNYLGITQFSQVLRPEGYVSLGSLIGDIMGYGGQYPKTHPIVKSITKKA